MASCPPFSVDFAGSAQELFVKIATMIHDHGGAITQRPFLLPCSAIQSFIKSHLPTVAQAQFGDL
ncbi:hypothetical protein [Paracidovorax cattleyae]|uniref:hypothetical protein n=1 Tax=Paracidovorax cattleyae TaxID=80868 RepID=UPI0018AF6C94|nr:hypothetical protein [Paracidovorax cattleyae]MBF9267025.1 hypothetical protein [Paracidovorax cattleyae]